MPRVIKLLSRLTPNQNQNQFFVLFKSSKIWLFSFYGEIYQIRPDKSCYVIVRSVQGPDPIRAGCCHKSRPDPSFLICPRSRPSLGSSSLSLPEGIGPDPSIPFCQFLEPFLPDKRHADLLLFTVGNQTTTIWKLDYFVWSLNGLFLWSIIQTMSLLSNHCSSKGHTIKCLPPFEN